MKIFKTKPEDSTQFRSDSPSIRAMRIILPVAAALSAVSLGGGVSAFLGLNFTNHFHLVTGILAVVAAFLFDGFGVTSGRSVVRELYKSHKGELDRDIVFWINLTAAAFLAIVVVLASFHASRNGVEYLVLEVKKLQEIRTQTDTTLNTSIAGATDQNAEILAVKKEAYNAQKAAIETTYAAKIEAVNIDIAKRKRQRTTDNYQYIDNLISRLEKQAAQLRAKQGEELAALAATFADEQNRLLATTESLTSVTVEDAKQASERRKKKQNEKDQADAKLAGMVSAAASWAIVLFLLIGLRLELLEVRNGIEPNPILSNFDLSGLHSFQRIIFAVPNFLLSFVILGSEKLYDLAAKKPTPIVDSDLIDYKAAQIEAPAVRKEGKIRTLPGRPAQRRAIGYNQVPKPDQDRENNSTPLMSTFEPSLNQETSEEKRAIVNQIKTTKRKLRKYKKLKSASFQKIQSVERKGEEPRAQTVQAYENRTQWVNRLEAEVKQLENQLNSIK